MKKLFIIAFVAMSGILHISADNVTFRASAPSVVEVGEKFRIQYSVSSQDVSDFSYPSFNGFDVIYGPSTSSQSSIQIINGNTTQSSSYTYTFTLMAQKTGTYTVPPASIRVNGKTYQSQSLKIKVVASTGGGGSQYNGQQQSRQRGTVTS